MGKEDTVLSQVKAATVTSRLLFFQALAFFFAVVLQCIKLIGNALKSKLRESLWV